MYGLVDCNNFYASCERIFKPKLNKKQNIELASCRFINENIVFMGKPGVGKTHLANAIGIEALKQGYKVLFLHINDLIDKLNAADSMIFQTEKQLKEFGEKLSDDKKAPIETALEELKKAHASQDVAAIDGAMEKINEAWKNASEELYKAQAESSKSDKTSTNKEDKDNKGAEDDVQDVDFEEVK